MNTLRNLEGILFFQDLQIYYEIFGDGHPIILVHGWGSDLQTNWVKTGLVKNLTSVRKVIALDCRGHGQSDKPYNQKIYSYSSMAKDVLKLMDLKIVKTDLFGYSMGAFMAVHLLGYNQERFSSMILVGIGDETEESRDAGFIADAFRQEDPTQIKHPLGRGYREYVDSNLNNDREALAVSALQMWPEGYSIQIGGVGLRKVSIPILIINGENDYPYVLSDKKLTDTIPDAQLLRIPNRNHLDVISDEIFKAEVLAFLGKQK
ncbi:MAG: alpha/beta fold hydrolase [Candidatus Thorarchaeota archaeon]